MRGSFGTWSTVAVVVFVLLAPVVTSIAVADSHLSIESIDDQQVEEGKTITVDVLATNDNGSDENLTLSLSDSPDFASLGEDENGDWQITISPGEGDAGNHTVEVEATDGDSTVQETFGVEVSESNEAPVIDEIGDQSVTEGETQTIDITATDPNGDPITLALDGGPSFVDLTDDNDGTGKLKLSPGEGDSGEYTVTIEATDGDLSDEESFTLTINEANSPPTLNPIEDLSVTETETETVDVSASDPNDDTIELELVDSPSFATLTDEGGGVGEIELSPDDGHAGEHDVTVRASDGDATVDETFAVTVTEDNQAPSLESVGEQSVTGGDALTVDISATDPDGDSIDLALVDGPSFAELTDHGNGVGEVELSPDVDDAGDYTVTVEASDGSLTDEVSFPVTVVEANSPPTLDPIEEQSVTETDTITVDVSATDPNDDTIELELVEGPSFATLTDNGDGTGRIELSPTDSDVGEYTLTVEATDGLASDDEEFDVIVTESNRAPTINTIEDQSLTEGDTEFVEVTASDPDGDSVGLELDNEPSFVTLHENSDGSGQIEIEPSEGDADEYSITVEASDGSAVTEETFGLVVGELNLAPTVEEVGNQTITEGETKTVDVSASDPNGDQISLEKADGPSFVSVTDHGDGTGQVQLSPSEGDAGDYSVTIEARDGDLQGSETFWISVVEANEEPTANGDSATVPRNESVAIDVLTNDIDVDGNETLDPSSVDVTNQPSNGTVSVDNSTGEITYTHDGSSVSADSFFYTVDDDEGATSNKAKVSVTITEPEETPAEDPSDDNDDDDDGSSGGGGGGGGSSGGSSGPSVDASSVSANQVQFQVEGASRIVPVKVRLPSMDGEAGDGTELTTVRITPGSASEFDVQVTRGDGAPEDTPDLDGDTGQSALAYFTLDHELDDDDVATARLTFRVEKSRLDAWGADPSSVTVYRYEDGGWARYDTRKAGEDANAHYFTASFPGLSRFAVGADRTITPTPTETATATTPTPTTPTATADPSPSSGEDTPDGGPVPSEGGLNPGLIVALVLLAVLFAVGYVGSGPLYRWYENR